MPHPVDFCPSKLVLLGGFLAYSARHLLAHSLRPRAVKGFATTTSPGLSASSAALQPDGSVTPRVASRESTASSTG